MVSWNLVWTSEHLEQLRTTIDCTLRCSPVCLRCLSRKVPLWLPGGLTERNLVVFWCARAKEPKLVHATAREQKRFSWCSEIASPMLPVRLDSSQVENTRNNASRTTEVWVVGQNVNLLCQLKCTVSLAVPWDKLNEAETWSCSFLKAKFIGREAGFNLVLQCNFTFSDKFCNNVATETRSYDLQCRNHQPQLSGAVLCRMRKLDEERRDRPKCLPTCHSNCVVESKPFFFPSFGRGVVRFLFHDLDTRVSEKVFSQHKEVLDFQFSLWWMEILRCLVKNPRSHLTSEIRKSVNLFT